MSRALLPTTALLVMVACGADPAAEAGGTSTIADSTTTSTTSATSTTTPRSTTTSSSTTTSTTTTTTLATTNTAAPTTTDPGSEYIGTTYSDEDEVGLHSWGGGRVAEPGPSGDGSPYSVSRWESGDDQMLWFEKQTGNGSERVVLDVVTFPRPAPDQGFVHSGCIADEDGMDVELHGVALHEGNNEWALLSLWRSDRAEEVWVELDPAGHAVETGTGTCELGAGDGALP